MGFDPQKIPLLRHAMETHRYPLTRIPYEGLRCLSNGAQYDCMLSDVVGSVLSSQPRFGWRGHVEAPTAKVSVWAWTPC